MTLESSFSYPDFFEKKAYPAFEKFWRVANRLLDALNLLTLNVGQPKEKHHLFIRSLCMMTGISLHDVSLLVANGCGISAMKIARTALESAINAEYLYLNPSECKDYVNWHYIEQHRRLEYIQKHMPDELAKLCPTMVAEYEKHYLAIRPDFLLPNGKKLRQAWCRLNLRQRAERTNFAEMYNAFYCPSSELSHGTFGSLAQHVESFTETGWQPAIPPSMTGCALALQAAHYCAFRALQTLVEMNETDLTPPIFDLKADYDCAWADGTEAVRKVDE
jgi:Family of unknown function (DUF5677)